MHECGFYYFVISVIFASFQTNTPHFLICKVRTTLFLYGCYMKPISKGKIIKPYILKDQYKNTKKRG